VETVTNAMILDLAKEVERDVARLQRATESLLTDLRALNREVETARSTWRQDVSSRQN
jgi:hypothetical protein